MRRSLAIAVVALAVAALAASTAGLGRTAGTAPAKKTAWFQLVFEGTAQAERIWDEGGPVGAGCSAQLHEDIDETVTFGRGKGVVMEFVQLGPGKYGFQRLGRTGDSSFNVVATVTRRTAGSADVVQDTSVPVPCPLLQHRDLSNAPDCGKPIAVNASWGLNVEGAGAYAHFRPAPTKGTVLRGAYSDNTCGTPPSDSVFKGGNQGDLHYAWPIPAQFTLEPIPFAKMFNAGYKAFKVDFKTLPKPNSKLAGKGGIGLVYSSTDYGAAEGTVRFIRCFPKTVAKAGQPAC
jgi:hypothetical protein